MLVQIIKDFCANCFCTSLLHTQIHIPCHASGARQVIKWSMIGQMAIAIALPGFNNLGYLVTPIFLLMIIFYTTFLHLA